MFSSHDSNNPEETERVNYMSDEDQRSQQTPSPSSSKAQSQCWEDQDEFHGVPPYRQMTVTPVIDHVALVDSVLNSPSVQSMVINHEIKKYPSLTHLHPVGV